MSNELTKVRLEAIIDLCKDIIIEDNQRPMKITNTSEAVLVAQSVLQLSMTPEEYQNTLDELYANNPILCPRCKFTL